MLLVDFLGVGKESAITASDIVAALNLGDTRVVSQMAEDARRAGIPLCASCGSNPGYYIAADVDEFAAYVCSLMRRLRELTKTLNACLNTLDKMSGQERIDLWDEAV